MQFRGGKIFFCSDYICTLTLEQKGASFALDGFLLYFFIFVGMGASKPWKSHQGSSTPRAKKSVEGPEDAELGTPTELRISGATPSSAQGPPGMHLATPGDHVVMRMDPDQVVGVSSGRHTTSHSNLVSL